MKRGLAAGWCLAVAAGTVAAPAPGVADLALARDYVLAACVMQRYPATPLATEAEVWAGGLVERGSLAATDYAALARLAARAPAPGVSRDGTVMRLQSCADFVHAPGFAAALRRSLRR